jgi:hypothetical protein
MILNSVKYTLWIHTFNLVENSNVLRSCCIYHWDWYEACNFIAYMNKKIESPWEHLAVGIPNMVLVPLLLQTHCSEDKFQRVIEVYSSYDAFQVPIFRAQERKKDIVIEWWYTTAYYKLFDDRGPCNKYSQITTVCCITKTWAFSYCQHIKIFSENPSWKPLLLQHMGPYMLKPQRIRCLKCITKAKWDQMEMLRTRLRRIMLFFICFFGITPRNTEIP